MKNNTIKNIGLGVAATAAAATAGYAALVVCNRARYGTVKRPPGSGASLLDRFLPEPEVLEHHHVEIDAPADAVLAAAKELELMKSPVIRAIIATRQLAMGGEADTRPHPTTLLEQMQSIGWVVLAERDGREIVFGSVTQPWEAAPVFRSIPAAEFRDFSEPGYVKIVWTLRAEPIDEQRATFYTETRVATTDPNARERFKNYWSFVAPGVELIRMAMLTPLKRAAERRVSKAVA